MTLPLPGESSTVPKPVVLAILVAVVVAVCGWLFGLCAPQEVEASTMEERAQMRLLERQTAALERIAVALEAHERCR